MDKLQAPYKIRWETKTFQGEWSAEEIDAGLASEPTIEAYEAWYENTPNGVIEITDSTRIQELNNSIKER